VTLATPEQAAKFLGLTPYLLRKWRETGEGPKWARLTQRTVRYEMAELAKWAAKMPPRFSLDD